jgi:shikimate dehydrogenase
MREQTSPRQLMYFIGVSTSGSSVMKLFPRWADTLGINAAIKGRDILIGSQSESYRRVVQEIAESEAIAGALVTTHKVSLYRDAGDLFWELDELAHVCREVSCISKRDGGLVGHAKDPLTVGLALDQIVGRGYWRSRDAWLLCLGAGGAGTALTVRLLSEAEPPRRIIVTDRDPSRVDSLKEIHGEVGVTTEVRYHLVTGVEDSDALIRSLPAGSVVVNATGMGKDTPGSPISDRAVFPQEGVAWELNYRGQLDFLRQARAQARERNLAVHDGWRYFLHGWSEHMAQVFHLDMTPDRFEALARDAEWSRPDR